MYSAGYTRIEGVNGAQDLERPFRIGNRILEQRGLVGSELILGVTGTGVPGGRYDRLVILDLTILDYDSV